MSYKPHFLTSPWDVDDFDLYKQSQYAEARRRALADAERTHEKVRDDLRRLARSVRDTNRGDGAGEAEEARTR